MIEYLKGKITIIRDEYIVLECSNIGYKIFFSEQSKVDINDEVTIFTYQLFKEDDISLFGFLENECKEFFERLISVKGIGVKTAMNALKNRNYKDIINAINNEDDTYLCSIPKISSKSAKQIIIDLKGILVNTVYVELNNELINVMQVLKKLGYSNKDLEIVENTLRELTFTNEQDCLRYAIKLLNNNDK